MGNVISDNQLVNPSFVFCYNGSNLQRGDYIDIIFDRNYVINILEGEISLDTFNKDKESNKNNEKSSDTNVGESNSSIKTKKNNRLY